MYKLRKKVDDGRKELAPDLRPFYIFVPPVMLFCVNMVDIAAENFKTQQKWKRVDVRGKAAGNSFLVCFSSILLQSLWYMKVYFFQKFWETIYVLIV